MILIAVVLLTIEPDWIDVPVLRSMQQCKGSTVLADIESRMPNNHGYEFPSMPMTWAHETTHGLNSRLRMGKPKCNVLYCMNGKAAIINEPKGTLYKVSELVPQSLRGPSFNLYLGQQRVYWDNTPTYILDEWVSYINGSECGSQVKEDGWHYELLQAINFTIYSVAMAKSIHETDPEYDHTQLRKFIKFNADRTLTIWNYLDSSEVNDTHISRIRAYLEAWRTGTESTSLRAFANQYFGESILGE